jgi:preprotein translocase SecE subunit
MFFVHNPVPISFGSKDTCSCVHFIRNDYYLRKKIKFVLNCNSEKKDGNTNDEDKSVENKEDKSVENKEDSLSFFKEITTEMKMIEWPSLDRLFKQFVIVVISLVFSAVFIYAIDGIFASLSKFLFEGN